MLVIRLTMNIELTTAMIIGDSRLKMLNCGALPTVPKAVAAVSVRFLP